MYVKLAKNNAQKSIKDYLIYIAKKYNINPSLLAQSPQLQFKERYLDDYNH